MKRLPSAIEVWFIRFNIDRQLDWWPDIEHEFRAPDEIHIPMNVTETSLLAATATIVSGYLRGQFHAIGELRRPLNGPELEKLIREVHATLARLGEPAESPRPNPAVPVSRSVLGQVVVCLECGKEASMLKRHIEVAHGMTPEAYRRRWELGQSYPLTAPGLTETRRRIAKEIGLGRLRARVLIDPLDRGR